MPYHQQLACLGMAEADGRRKKLMDQQMMEATCRPWSRYKMLRSACPVSSFSPLLLSLPERIVAFNGVSVRCVADQSPPTTPQTQSRAKGGRIQKAPRLSSDHSPPPLDLTSPPLTSILQPMSTSASSALYLDYHALAHRYMCRFGL